MDVKETTGVLNGQRVMKKIKIFCSNCLTVSAQGVCYVTPINWILKLHHSKFALSKQDFLWTDPYFLIRSEDMDLEEAYNLLVEEEIDIVVFSVYIWNKNEFFTMARYFKEKNPNLQIIAGGPELDAHRDLSFFEKYNFLDWVIFGEGEIAFSRLLDHIGEYDVELVNVIPKNGEPSKHEPVNKKDDILKFSIYMEFEEEITKFFKWFKDKGVFYALAWETTKGCPYLCSFCDWSSGLHHKVRIWGKDELIPPWKKELDFFSRIGLPAIYWTNPNVGLAHQDSEIVDYLCEMKYSNQHTPYFLGTQFSKTKKEHSYALLDKMLTAKFAVGLKFDLQDLDPQVLKYIDRPEIEWDYHKTLIKQIIDKHCKIQENGQRANPIWVNFIWGMPGQTLNHMRHNMIESGDMGMFPNHHIFEMLPNSPAAEPAYMEKFRLKVNKIYLRVADGIGKDGPIMGNHYANAITENLSLSNADWFKGVFIFNLYSALIDFNIDYDVSNGPSHSLLGKEKQFFDNCLLFLHEVIDNSYRHYQLTNEVGVLHDNKLYAFKNWTVSRRDVLIALFENNNGDLSTLTQNLDNNEHMVTLQENTPICT